MQILLTELGNQHSSYLADKLGGEFRLHVPDYSITSKSEAGDPVPNPLLDITLPVINGILASRSDVIVRSFPHETGPAIIIGSQERLPELAQALLGPLQSLVAQGCVNGVEFEKSFYRY